MSRSKTKKTNPGGNNLILFFAIIVVLAIVSMVVAYFYSGEKKPDEVQQTTQIEGTWVSNYDGAMLTIEGYNITLESPSVDNGNLIRGSISLEKNIVTFIFENGPCDGIEGHYLYTIDEEGLLFFKLIKDECSGRRDRMSMKWFKL